MLLDDNHLIDSRRLAALKNFHSTWMCIKNSIQKKWIYLIWNLHHLDYLVIIKSWWSVVSIIEHKIECAHTHTGERVHTQWFGSNEDSTLTKLTLANGECLNFEAKKSGSASNSRMYESKKKRKQIVSIFFRVCKKSTKIGQMLSFWWKKAHLHNDIAEANQWRIKLS